MKADSEKRNLSKSELDALVRLAPGKRIEKAKDLYGSDPHLLEELSAAIGRKEYMESLGVVKKVALIPVVLANIAALTAILFIALTSVLMCVVHGKDSAIAFMGIVDIVLIPSFLIACAVKLFDRKLSKKMSLKIKEAGGKISKPVLNLQN